MFFINFHWKTELLKGIYSDVNKKQEINNKIRETCLLKYGDEHYSNRIKAKETCLKKYGVEYTGQIPQKIEKTKNTFLEKYGVDSVFKVQKFRN